MSRRILIVSIIFSMLLPFLVGADIAPGTIPGDKELGIPESPIKTPKGLLDTIASIVKWVYIIFFIIAVMFFLFAAFKYLGGAGSPERLKKVHDMIIYAAVAIAIAFLSVGVATIIKNFLQSSAGTEESSEPQPDQKPSDPYEQLPPPWNPPIEQPDPGGTISI